MGTKEDDSLDSEVNGLLGDLGELQLMAVVNFFGVLKEKGLLTDKEKAGLVLKEFCAETLEKTRAATIPVPFEQQGPDEMKVVRGRGRRNVISS